MGRGNHLAGTVEVPKFKFSKNFWIAWHEGEGITQSLSSEGEDAAVLKLGEGCLSLPVHHVHQVIQVSIQLPAGRLFDVILQGISEALVLFGKLITLFCHGSTTKEGDIFLCIVGSALLVEPLEVFGLKFN